VTRLRAEVINKVAELLTLPPTAIIDLGGFHASMIAWFDAIIGHCRGKSLPDDAASELIYPLVALVDETLLSSPKYRAYWTERPLQLRYFGEVIAGTKFFAKLEAHIRAGEPNIEILEAYFMSLALGLKGMYGGEEAKRRARIMDSLGAILTDSYNKNRKVPETVDKTESARSWSTLAFAVLTAVAAAVMIITAFIRGAAIRNLIEFLGGI
jgi:type IV/VI secretion system ImpK/VasF family protein